MNIIDTIQADQIEDGDQILVQGDPLEDVEIVLDDAEGRIISGYSHNEGDRVVYTLHFTDLVDVWAV